ncbi:pyridoxamine 5'-phosphate oxidase family protein [Actinomadura logoneensis]|uniref:Pyridoxamine 5'-phosphate oxidase family protein n=1 Tax=Actinomadura logoneensis TaxID=2293572 RepID=A0A372JIV1_9ACTN|nr:pyridoxamine 5'-phosphate oxidase family protein [Actinomadura logoneensis]RFU39941.1 pyridoxamine 5'-phosphate oxidase family protein [Actinomadura logoneensis]
MADSDELVQRSHHLLANARFMTLATTDGDEPWASTVNFVALYRPLRLLYYSLHTARHSRNVANNPLVSGSIYMTGLPGFGLDGAQFTGHCLAVGPDQLAQVHRTYYELNFPDENTRREWLLPQSEFHGTGPRRFYMVQVRNWWLLDIDRWLVDKHDQRVEVPVQDLHLLTDQPGGASDALSGGTL